MNRPTPFEIYGLLYARYGNLRWWPAESPFEIITGAILTQNTAWGNVEKAIANFNGHLTPARMEEIDMGELMELIRPAGFYRQKAVYLKALTEWYKRYGYSPEKVSEKGVQAVRKELLAVRGVGRETADAILLYAFGLLSFVTDAYTLRLLDRLGLTESTGRTYENIKLFFESGLPRDWFVYNNLHACIVMNAKAHCRARPRCEGCPLAAVCAEPFKGFSDTIG